MHYPKDTLGYQYDADASINTIYSFVCVCERKTFYLVFFLFATTYKTLDFNVFINYLLRLYKHFIARNMDNVNCFIGIAIICYNVVYWLKLKHSTWLGQ